jgi:thiosulfate/3-mercaptopyruvate sulfurtransferase
MKDGGYSNPDVLVSTEWVAENLNDPSVRIVESDEDVLLYDVGHIPGAIKVDWVIDLNDRLRRDYLDKEGFDKLLSEKGIANDSLVVFYGDKNNWWACYAFWVFQLFGHSRAVIMDGGRIKWIAEGRPLERALPNYRPVQYKAQERVDYKIRAFRDQVLAHVQLGMPLIDVRSPGEYKGTSLGPGTSHGDAPSQRTGPLNQLTNCGRFTKRSKDCHLIRTSLRIAESASVRHTPGLY